jgi:hypothetical protein
VKLIQDFSTKIKQIPESMDASDVPAAKLLLSNLRRGDLNFGEATKEMKSMLGKHKIRVRSGKDIAQQFEEWINEMEFAPNRKAMMEKLTAWQKGELTDYAMLVFIEGKVANGEVPGNWLDESTAGPDQAGERNDGESFDPTGLEFDTATNGWKLHDVLKAAVEKAAATKDKNIVG